MEMTHCPHCGSNLSKPVKVRKKRCAKCGLIKPLTEFDPSCTSDDGHQSYCKGCKKDLGKRRQQRSVAARLRHHMATRIATQLGDNAPDGMTSKLDILLGYRIQTLVKALSTDLREREGKKLRDALEEGYHVDHIKPLSSFKVIVGDHIDMEAFQECWAISNLRAIPAAENLAKGARIE